MDLASYTHAAAFYTFLIIGGHKGDLVNIQLSVYGAFIKVLIVLRLDGGYKYSIAFFRITIYFIG